MDCSQIIVSNDYLDLVVLTDETSEIPEQPDCIQVISGKYEIIYYNRQKTPPFGIDNYTYSAIPKCFGLLDSSALSASGIIQVQNQPALSLKGNGVLVGFIDTGIDYTSKSFRNVDGSTRIMAIWDQSETQITDKMPRSYQYGAEYTKEDINQALMAENPYSIVPQKDEDGHGTYLAGIACGGANPETDFTGAAPESQILMVKLKPAKQYLKDYYFIPDDSLVFEEGDIMTGIAWMIQLAREKNMPLVICIGLGTNNASHTGSSLLSDYLNEVATMRQIVVVIATGNEANARHHYAGLADEFHQPSVVEINVDQNIRGFYVEFWADAPEIFAVSLRSPTGEIIPKIPPRSGGHQEYEFVFENTTIIIDYRIVGRTRADQLIYIRFLNAAKGIWQINVYPENIVTGKFNMWLPMRRMLDYDVYFLESVPDVTLTTPSSARIPIGVGGYNSQNDALYLDSGRGYTAIGEIKPDFTAPCVNVSGTGLRDNYVQKSGTSAAAAITAGASAQLLEWAIVRGNDPFYNTVTVKNVLIRGCDRNPSLNYPNPSWGYGKLNLYNAFLNM